MDEIENILPEAEGIVEAEQSAKVNSENKAFKNCLNCGTELYDSYCAHCGQKNLPARQTMGELIENFIGSFFSFESKFFRTVRYLLFKPGYLPVEYIKGKRESYFHPARAYVFISFIFFLVFFSLPEKKETDLKNNKTDLTKNENQYYDANELDSLETDSTLAMGETYSLEKGKFKVKIDTLKKKKGKNFDFTSSEYKSVEAYDSAQKTVAPEKRDNWLERAIQLRVIELNKKYDGDGSAEKFSSDFKNVFLNNLSRIIFLLLPVFALLLKLLYVRRDYYFSEHLVFSINYYNFSFLAGTLVLVTTHFDGLGWLTFFLGLWIATYLLIAMKRMYLQSWGKTILKYLIFATLFSFCVLLGMLINVTIAILIL